MSEAKDNKTNTIQISKKRQFLLLLLAFLFGAFWLFAIRFVTLQKQEVHYHANFAVFVDGERLPFDNFTFYEEVQTCFDGEGAVPQSRVHMHDNVNHIVHVHDNAVTWGHFFANLGMTNGDTIFRDGNNVYVEDDATDIRFILNGEEISTTANRVIDNEDVLLVSIGNTTEEDLQSQYEQVEKNAAEYNDKNDPSSCSGGKPFTLTERLKAAIGIGE